MATPRKAPLPSQQQSGPSAPSTAASSTGDSAEKGSSVQVVVRCRPPSEKEKQANDTMVVGCYQSCSEVRVLTNGRRVASSSQSGALQAQASKSDANTKTYTFDQTYGALSTQEEVYNNAVKPLVEEVLGGFNCTVFAYGQTGTGKTHTMEGALGSEVSENSGIIPRSIHTIFEQLQANKYEDYSVKVSFLELYNEELADLLCEQEERTVSSSMGASSASSKDDSDKKELRIFEDPSGKKGMMVQNLEEVLVESATAVFTLLNKANKNRRVAETNLNARSSRSHYVFTITVHTKEYNEDGEDIIKSGKLYLVDLAGSECIGKSGAVQVRAKEAGKINQSLLTLGRVINALVDRASFIPYRDSKLTRLLQESLGGRAKTVIIATVSPSYAAFDETLSTLEYAHRAKSIKNKPQVNQKMTKRAYMKELLAEIASLKRDNEVLRSKNGIIIAPEKYERMLAEEKGKGMQIDELLFKINTQQTGLDALQASLSEKESALTLALAQKAELTVTLQETTELLDSTRVLLATSKAHLLASQELLVTFQRRLHAREIELENTGALLDAQRATEYRLTSQALQVLSALESAQTEREALHAKVGRKAAVEAHNETASHEFQRRIIGEFDELQRGETGLQQDARDHLAQLRGSVDSGASDRATAVAALGSAQAAFDAAIAAKTAALTKEVSDFHHAHLEASVASNDAAASFHSANADKVSAVQQRGDEEFAAVAAEAAAVQQLTSAAFAQAQQNAQEAQTASVSFVDTAVVPALTQIESAASAHSSEAVDASAQCATVLAAFESSQTERVASDAAKLHERIAAMQAANAARINELAAANAARLSKLQQEQAAHVARLQAELVQQSAAMQAELLTQSNSMQSELVQSVSEMEGAFMAEVSAMIEAHKTAQTTQLRASVADVTSRVNHMAAAESAAIQALHSSVESAKTVSAGFVAQVQARTAEQSAAAAQAQATIVAQQDALSARVSQSQSAQHAALDAILSSNTARRDAAVSEGQMRASLAGQFLASQTQGVECAQDECTARGVAVSSWILEVQSADAAVATSLNERAGQVESRLTSHGASFQTTLSSASSHLERYITSDLRRDIRLGTTPQKGAAGPAYPSQRDLARTDSPGTVVRSYRATNPAKSLAFQGLVHMEGIEEILAAAAEEGFDAATMIPAVALASVSVSAAPAPVAAAGEASEKRVSAGAPAAAAVVPLPADFSDEEDSENAKPVAANIAAAPLPAADPAEKPVAVVAAPAPAAAAAVAGPGHKRQLSAPSSKLTAPTAASAAAASGKTFNVSTLKPGSRLRFGTLPASSNESK